MTRPVFSEALSCLASAIGLSFIVSTFLVGLFLRLSKKLRVYALPGERQCHSGSRPTGGGTGLIAAVALVSLLLPLCPSGEADMAASQPWLHWVLPGAVLLSMIGWLDDRRPVSPLLRFIVQLAVSFGLIALLRGAGLDWSWMQLVVGGIMVVWLMNLYNFMDGSHGMAGFEGLFVSTVFAVLAWQAGNVLVAAMAGIVAAACAGFLPWNFPAPKIFMGDAGSVPVGFMLGALILIGGMTSSLPLPLAVLALSVFLVDSSLTLSRRVIRGERWYTPHAQHIYQRLIAQGWSHSRVLRAYQALNLVVVVPAIVLAEKLPAQAWLITGVVLSVMTAGWLVASSRLEMRS